MTHYLSHLKSRVLGSTMRQIKSAPARIRTWDPLLRRQARDATEANASKESTHDPRRKGVGPHLLSLPHFSGQRTQNGPAEVPECPWCKTPGAANEETDDGRFLCGRCEAVYA